MLLIVSTALNPVNSNWFLVCLSWPVLFSGNKSPMLFLLFFFFLGLKSFLNCLKKTLVSLLHHPPHPPIFVQFNLKYTSMHLYFYRYVYTHPDLHILYITFSYSLILFPSFSLVLFCFWTSNMLSFTPIIHFKFVSLS